jgi:glucose/arabinose dehydrogenase
MRHATSFVLLSCFLALGFSGCGDVATVPIKEAMGPNPKLPPPKHTLVPTVNIAPAKGWPEGGKPVAASGLAVAAFASGFEHPRWLYVLPNGDVLKMARDSRAGS